MTAARRLRDVVSDLRVAFAFYTRIPPRPEIDQLDLARASWAAPVVGAVIGLVGAAIYGTAHAVGLPAFAAAALALAAMLWVTGCLHEDGLADTLDGFGGGASRERKLEIMRDSRIGTYGACALALSILLRAGALASISQDGPVIAALIAAHASARSTIPLFMRLVPPARVDGLSAAAGEPPFGSALGAAAIGAAALLLGLGVRKSLIAVAVLVSIMILIGRLCIKQIGGQTGDVLGALEQTGEIAVLLIAAAHP
jgi:adenosylcobinamide-GDP ribazoletransferase